MKPHILRRILAVAILLGGFGIMKFLQSQKSAPPKLPDTSSALKVEQVKVENELIDAFVDVSGPLTAKDKIEVFSEVGGRVLNAKKQFKEGVSFRKGEVLFQMDASNLRLSLSAQKSALQSAITSSLANIKLDYPSEFDNWYEYAQNLNPAKALPALPGVINPQLKNFLINKNIYNQFFNVKSQEAQLAKYTVRAPFTGTVSNANVTPGIIVRAGQKIGDFINQSAFELEVGISLNTVDKIKVGSKINLKSEELNKTWEGRVSRINKNIDGSTQTAKAFVSVSGDQLFDGMYLSGELPLGEAIKGIKIPSNILVNQSQVYTAVNNKLLLKDIKVEHTANEYYIISGLEDGSMLINQVLSGVVEGTTVEAIAQ